MKIFIFRNTDTIIHLLKSSLGTGILAMPVAFHHAGYLVGSIGTVVLGLIAVYCIHMLLAAHYELCKRKRVSRTFDLVAFTNIYICYDVFYSVFTSCVIFQ